METTCNLKKVRFNKLRGKSCCRVVAAAVMVSEVRRLRRAGERKSGQEAAKYIIARGPERIGQIRGERNYRK